ncbi:hypothetical protein [Pseudarthrobacter sp. S9]|uniref:hypothetical protein n=1 Tax=Pseudarthrobacter sp. S9 TaxID=3418421 RepID=UPI003D007402
MSQEHAAAQNMRHVLEHMVHTLATGTERIQQRLADAYDYSRFGDQTNLSHDLPPGIQALQIDLRAALSTVHDAERGQATASAARLSDDQCVIFARRIIAAEHEIRHLCGNEAAPGPPR